MYRVFESLDELFTQLENARALPLSENCMVPRNNMLLLLSELREALPAEIDDAQDVLDKRDSILDTAEETAENLVADAEANAADIVARAREEAERALADAQVRAEAILDSATADAERTVSDAQRRSDDMIDRATAESERLLASGNEAYNRSVEEGLAEQQRLISESEVVRRANEEAHRIVDAAHSDSKTLRTECDTYVDNKLREFEEALNATLRTVTSDRAALRRGAGATGASIRREQA